MNTIEKHRLEPNKSLGDYIKERRLALGLQLKGTKKIYLDTKYWLLIRDAVIGRAKSDLQYKLLDKFKQMTAKGECIFPISESIFSEIHKQSDEFTFTETIKLIDTLSKGVCICNEFERYKFELHRFMLEKAGQNVHDPQELIWTKVSFIYDEPARENPYLSKEDNLAIQKAVLDQMWDVSLLEMVNIIKKNSSGRALRERRDISAELNEGKFNHLDDQATFDQMFAAEIGGLMEGLNEFGYLDDIVNRMGYQLTGIDAPSTDSGKLLASSVYHAFKQKKLKSELPTYRIGSGLFAAVRWDRKQKFKKNDFDDFHHAKAAIPYCDYFFTEKSLCNLATQKLLQYDKLCDCTILWRLEEVLDCVNNIDVKSTA